jgi:nucleotide-binding universal stress UspA family protein
VKRVLCAVDLSDLSVELLECAAAIVQWYGGCLTILHVVPTFDAVERHPGEWFDPVTVVYSMRRDEVIEHMRQAAAAAGIPDDRVRYEAESGEPGMTIVARALAFRADTIVLGTRARRGLDRLLGSVTDSVLRHAPCDVLTVPPRLSSARGNVRASRIVCGIDFSTRSLHALRATFGLADRIDARVELVHAIEWLAEVEPPDDVDFNVSDFRTRLVYNAQRRLDALVTDEAPLGRAVRTKVAIGRSHRELLGVAAEEHADLIVLGNHGRGGATLPFLGSTVEQIVRAASCPVLTIRSPHERLWHGQHP